MSTIFNVEPFLKKHKKDTSPPEKNVDNELLYELMEYGTASKAKTDYNNELCLGFLALEDKQSSANSVIEYLYKVALENDQLDSIIPNHLIEIDQNNSVKEPFNPDNYLSQHYKGIFSNPKTVDFKVSIEFNDKEELIKLLKFMAINKWKKVT